jgi:putative hydrolase of the HAD superfamily
MKSIIFDFYGTLAFPKVRTSPYQRLFKSLSGAGISYRSFTEQVMTQNFDSFSAIATELGLTDKDFSNLEQALAEEINSVILYDEVAQVLEKLSKQTEIYLLSNLATPYKSPFYTLGLDQWINAAFFSCDIGHIKPQASAFEYVLSSINKSPEEVIMIGDSFNADFLGAKNCGIEAIWLQRKQGKNPMSIQSLLEIELA